MAKLSNLPDTNGNFIKGSYYMHCPGCGFGHQIRSKEFEGKGPKWDFNGDMDNPTFSPSLRVQGGSSNRMCHSFIRNGHWQFLSDCTHHLAGKTVPMVDAD